ncbi:DNA-processing protein DprA [Niallia circulans]|nr:DNA-processing protein DprA [Niallia circulans]
MVHDLRETLIVLHHCRKMTWKRIFTILKSDQGLHFLHDSCLPNTKFLEKETIEDFYSHTLHQQIQQYTQQGIHIITYFDPSYPSLLKEIYQPPWVLYAKGDLSLLQQPRQLAIVGSRDATVYSRRAVKAIMQELVNEEVVIVSGLAAGVDALAHETALEFNGKTIGILAGGFKHIYPKHNLPLAEKMMKTQLLLSEYPPFTRPQKWQFPMRNRIISGITKGTLVVEAKRKSGSLITANLALQEGRDVFAIPGSIFSKYSEGTNDLIKHGAKLVTNAADILEEWEFTT